MERLGAVERVATRPHMVMPLRPVWHLCHNQRRLNRYITKFKFKLDSLRELVKSVQRSGFLFASDLTSAYTHILIHPKHRRFMGFRFRGQNTTSFAGFFSACHVLHGYSPVSIASSVSSFAER